MTKTRTPFVVAAFIAAAGGSFIAGATHGAAEVEVEHRADKSATACDLCAATGARVDALTDEAAYARADAACAFAYDAADVPFKAADARTRAACNTLAAKASQGRGTVNAACEAAKEAEHGLYAAQLADLHDDHDGSRDRRLGLNGCRRDPGRFDQPASSRRPRWVGGAR